MVLLRAHVRRWRKYSLTALVIGAIDRARHVITKRVSGLVARPNVIAGAAPAWDDREEFAVALAARLGLTLPRPGEGIPPEAPFFVEPADRVLPAADTVRRHHLDLLGSGLRDFGDPVDWHRDPISGFRWPRAHVSRFRRDAPEGADIKVAWELGRCLHFGPLLKAYLITGDGMWAREIASQVRHFMQENAPGFGVQWTSAMDVAIRAINWTYALLVLSAGPDLTQEERDAWLDAMWEHGRFVRSNLSWNPHSPGNHYVSELVGLLHVGLVFGWTARGRRWARDAARRLRREIRRQVYFEGTDWEASTNYHRLVSECFAVAELVCRRTTVPLGLPEDPEFVRRVGAMLDFVGAYTRPDGSAPLLGDVDDGYVVGIAAPVRREPDRHAASLALYRTSKPAPDLNASSAWPQGGFFALRGRDALVFLRCGPVGLGGRGAHDHADQLAVDVTLAGVTLFPDPGSYVYTRDPDARRHFRSTAVHNTVTVDGCDQVVFSAGTLFEVDLGAAARCEEWEAGTQATVFAGLHEGYRRLPRPVVHRRWVRLAADGRRLDLIDVLDGPDAEHDVRVTFQCAANADVTVRQSLPGPVVEVALEGLSFRVAANVPPGVTTTLDEGAVSRRYGIVTPAPRIRFGGLVRVPVELGFEIRVVG